jgi:dTDP-4-dehydrorhamnose reductase
MKTVLIVGCRGMLGSYLARYIPSAERGVVRVAGCDLPDIDITSAESVRGVLMRERPEVVINCAAYTNVDGAETEAEAAFRINSYGPGVLAKEAAAAGTALVHMSTDFIFDGVRPGPYREDDVPNPQSVYAKSKLAGEEAVAANTRDWLIVRTAWLYGPNGKNFVDTILRLAREKGALTVVDDQAGSPTFTGVLAEYLWKLVRAKARGVYHVAGSGVCTWYDLAREAVYLAGLDVPVKPVTTAEFPRPAKRPRNSALDVGKTERLLGERIPNWRMGLEVYLRPR